MFVFVVFFVCVLLLCFFGGRDLSHVAECVLLLFFPVVLFFRDLICTALCSHVLGFKQKLLQHEIYPSWEKSVTPADEVGEGGGGLKKVTFRWGVHQYLWVS